MSRGRHAVVINADDFGMSEPVNRGIAAAFRAGTITSATVMANMPAFADACAIARADRLEGRIGVHLTLTEGPSLTAPIRSWPRLCRPDGELIGVPGSIFRLAPDEARAIETELVAQIEAVRLGGIRPTHFDSHGHFHTQWPVATIVMRLARRYGVPAIRLTRNCGAGIGTIKRVYKAALNARLDDAGFARTRHFGSAFDAASLPRLDGPLEIMVHPSVDVGGRVVDLTPDAGPLEAMAARWRRDFPLVSYGELCSPTQP